MSDPSDQGREIRRRRLRYRCWHRGSREADLLLGRFADANIALLDDAGLDQLETLLDHADPDIWDWAVGRQPVPPALDHGVMRRLRFLTTRLKST